MLAEWNRASAEVNLFNAEFAKLASTRKRGGKVLGIDVVNSDPAAFMTCEFV
jgi:hypothetical protein